MRRGPWHQFGDKSQRLALEQLQAGLGVGVILSPRNLASHKATEYAAQYHNLGADVLIDHQFYNPAFSNDVLSTYPINQYRVNISDLHQISDIDLTDFTSQLRITHRDISANGVIAPAVIYQAGSDQCIELNTRLFNAAKTVGDELGIPTYATVVLGRSVSSSSQAMGNILSSVTALNSDGWYYGFEFGPERIPSNSDEIIQLCSAGLTLACTGKPVLHAYAGPTSLLSLGFGATGVGIGHSQKLWKFNGENWTGADTQGGGGNSPARFFSRSLWGTIICPDEIVQIPQALRSQVLTHSPFCTQVLANNAFPWPRWEANKHLLYTICSTITDLADNPNARANLQAAVSVLEQGNSLYHSISHHIAIRDLANVYHNPWIAACNSVLQNRADDYDYLEMLS